MKGLIRCILLCGALYGGWKKLNPYFSGDQLPVIIQADGQLSESARETIKVHVQSLLKKALPLNEIGALVQQAFPHINKVAVAKDPLKKVRVALTVSSPLAVCNSSLVLCANNQVVSKNIFADRALHQLPDYQIARALADGAEETENSWKNFVRTCDPDLHTQYKIAWHNPHTVYLQDKEHPAVTLVLNEETIKDVRNVKLAYTALRDCVLSQKAPIKKNTVFAWHIDGRFKNQMVVVPRGVMG